jgi:hypothetical protein
MLGYVALIFIIYLSVKLSFQLAKHKQVLQTHGVSSAKFKLLQFSSLFYIVSLVGFALPLPWLDLFRPIPTGFLILLPGIVLGKKISNTMERVGVDTAANAGRAANNIMWLGIGTGIFMAANIILGLIISGVGSDIPV